MRKVAVIGAGNVGGCAAWAIATRGIADVALVDRNNDIAYGKALDISDSLAFFGSDSIVRGGSDYGLVEGADIVVITAGVARKPGMLREDLLKLNMDIAQDVINNVCRYLNKDKVVWIVVTNPLDIITTFAAKQLDIDRKKVFGAGVGLDSARFVNILSEKLGIARSSLKGAVLASHGKDMLVLEETITIDGLKVQMAQDAVSGLKEMTVNRGAQIVSAFKNGSAYFAPGASVYQLADAILSDSRRVCLASVKPEGELGIDGGCIGLPVVVTQNGWERIAAELVDVARLPELKAASDAVMAALAECS